MFFEFHESLIIDIAILLKFENNIRESYQSVFFSISKFMSNLST